MSLADGLAFQEHHHRAPMDVGAKSVARLAQSLACARASLDLVPSLAALGTSPVSLQEMVTACGSISVNMATTLRRCWCSAWKTATENRWSSSQPSPPERAMPYKDTLTLVNATWRDRLRRTGNAIRTRYASASMWPARPEPPRKTPTVGSS
jgi:hypothetical protein